MLDNIEVFHSILCKFRSVQLIREHCRAQMKNKLEKQVFKLRRVISDHCVQHNLFLRDPVEALREQVHNTPSTSIKTKHSVTPSGPELVYSPPLNSVVALEAFPRAGMALKRRNDREVCWRSFGSDGAQSLLVDTAF